MHGRFSHGPCQHAGAHRRTVLCRGIDVVRNKIKMFAQKKVTLPPGRHKVVILDEADRCSPIHYLTLTLTLTLQSHSAAQLLQTAGRQRLHTSHADSARLSLRHGP